MTKIVTALEVNSRWWQPPFLNQLNINNSASVERIRTKVLQRHWSEVPERALLSKFLSDKIQDGGGRHLRLLFGNAAPPTTSSWWLEVCLNFTSIHRLLTVYEFDSKNSKFQQSDFEVWSWSMIFWPWRWPQLMLQMTPSNARTSKTTIWIPRLYLCISSPSRSHFRHKNGKN